MAKEDKKPIDGGEIAMTIDEFCASLSKDDRRVELIGGFHHVEKAAGHIKDTWSNFRSRFDAFVNAPA